MMLRFNVKVLLILSFLLLYFSLAGYCQSDNGVPVDEEFNLFLLSILILFLGAMLGTALVAVLLLLIIVAVTVSLVSFGILSTSFFIGLYKRSFAAGFKTFIYASLITLCSMLGIAGLFFCQLFFDISISKEIMLLTGLGSGLATGLILGLITVKSLGWISRWMFQRLMLTNKD